MKFVALLSGGKDSCFNITHCQKNGHKLVAAASLRPQEGIDELDSYLYQTVGQDAIEFVAQALGVPLYRRVIVGTAVQMENEYGTREGISESSKQEVDGDETEDMFQLLKEVLRHHPEVEAVSVGAILSTYQRIRVEHVCRRLGLTSLSYLWQRDQGDLLQEMIDSGVNAILIKVAGIGLKPQHLGLSLAQMQPLLQSLHDRFGSHICGEGGEYETLTLDCPAFTKKIEITETETIIHEDKGFATVAYWRIKSARLQAKAYMGDVSLSPSLPPLLDETAKQIYDAAMAIGTPIEDNRITPRTNHATPTSAFSTSSIRHGNWIAVGNVFSNCERTLTVEEETELSFKNLKALLSQHNSDLTAIVHINALLSSIDYFAAFNGVYSRMFGTSPPARACVAVNLPPTHRVMLECIVYIGALPSERHALHVQGISYWAPANIGPYSQAIGIDGLFHISGQIGLIPYTMTMPTPSDVAKEAALSLQHVRRIREVLPLTPSIEDAVLYFGLVVWTTLTEALPLLATELRLAMDLNGASLVDGSNLRPTHPPMLLVVPTALPKGAAVEIQTIFQALQVPGDEDPSLSFVTTKKRETDLLEEHCQVSNGRSFTVLWLNENAFGSMVDSVQRRSNNPLSLRVYYRKEPSRSFIEALSGNAAVTAIPVEGVFSIPELNGALPIAWDLAIVILTL